MDQPKGYVSPQYLQAAAEIIKRNKQRSYALMHIEPGHAVLDSGCGSGIDTVSLGQIVGPTGSVVGVDYDAAMLAEADRRAVQVGVDRWVKHTKGDVTNLPYEPGTFDSCRSERVFQHLSQPNLALTEMIRVIRPGGWVVVLDTDWGTASVDSPDIDIERRLARVRAERTMNNGYAGRQLYRLFKEYELKDITVEMLPTYLTSYALARELGLLERVESEALAAGILIADEVQRWRRSLEHYDADGVFFASVSSMLVAGRRL